MRTLWDGLGLLLATLCGVTGCTSPNVAHRPPKPPEEILVPPLADAKFSKPPEYPKGTLNQDAVTPAGSGMAGPGPGMSSAGSGLGGMNSMGGLGRGLGPTGGR